MLRRWATLTAAGLLLVAAAAGCRGGGNGPPPETPPADRAVRYAPADLVFPQSLFTDNLIWGRTDVDGDGKSIRVTYGLFAPAPAGVRIEVAPLPADQDAADLFEETKVAFGLGEPSSRAVGGGASTDLLLGQAVGGAARFALYRTDGPGAAAEVPLVILLGQSDLAGRPKYVVKVRADFAAADNAEGATRTAVADLMRQWRAANGLAVPATRPGF